MFGNRYEYRNNMPKTCPSGNCAMNSLRQLCLFVFMLAGAMLVAADVTPPTVISISRISPVAQQTNATGVTFQVGFSEDVTGMNNGLFIRGGNSLNTNAPTVVGVSADIYNVTVDNIVGSGKLWLELYGNSGVTDLAGNALDTSVSFSSESYIIDNVPPKGEVISGLSGLIGNTMIPLQFVFDEPVQGFDADDVQVVNATKGTA